MTSGGFEGGITQSGFFLGSSWIVGGLKMRIIVICTGNSCRSQMAEAWVNFLAPSRIGALSAGTNPTGYVHPKAIDVMNEVGIDMGEFKSKSVSQFIDREFDYVITVCDDAAEHCPTFPGSGKRIHWPFEDPASFVGSEDEVKDTFRKTRNDIRTKVDEFLRALSN